MPCATGHRHNSAQQFPHTTNAQCIPCIQPVQNMACRKLLQFVREACIHSKHVTFRYRLLNSYSPSTCIGDPLVLPPTLTALQGNTPALPPQHNTQ